MTNIVSPIRNDSTIATAAPQPRSLKVNFSWMLVGMITYAVCQWGCLIVLAKYGSREMVGQFALCLAVTAPVFMLSNLKLRNVQATDARQLFRFSDYFTLRCLTTAAALLIIVIAVMAGSYSSRMSWLIIIVAFGRGFDSINDITYGLLQLHERMERVSWAMMFNGIASLALLAGGTILFGDVLYGVVGWTAGFAITSCAARFWIGRGILKGTLNKSKNDQTEKSRTRVLGRLALTAFPLGIVMMLVSLSSNLPSYVVEAQLGESALGVFAATVYLIEAGRRVILALGQSASPRLAKHFASGDLQSFVSLLLRLIVLGICGGLAGVILSWSVGQQVLSLLYTSEYAQHVQVLIAISFVAILIFSSSFLSDAMIASRQLRSQVPLLIVVVAATAVGALQLVPRFGLLGAVYAIAIGSFCHVAGSTAIVIWSLRQRQRQLKSVTSHPSIQ